MNRSPTAMFARPIQFEISDEDDLARIPVALDEVATLLAEYPAWVDVPDIETEPLASLLARAAELLPRKVAVKFRKFVKDVDELERLAGQIRYGSAEDEVVERAEQIRLDVEAGLELLEQYLE